MTRRAELALSLGAAAALSCATAISPAAAATAVSRAGAGAAVSRAAGGAAVSPAAARAASVDPLLAAARLSGKFQLAGRITVATRVRGERAGQTFMRTWKFTPHCATGACGNVTLFRRRAGGSDTLTLHRRSPAYYTGSGSFYVPLRCGSTTYRRGELASFSITVRIDGAARDLATGNVLATHVTATYNNSSRRNLTPCVDFPGRDAARYHGHAVAG
jgi:hypothetical protein